MRKKLDTWESLYQSALAEINQIHDTRDELDRKSADFLKVDIETALTFSRIALQSNDPDRKQRNRKNARKGYDTILRFLPKVPLETEDRDYLSTQMQELKANLQNLGEEF
jgi:hypothetical protein